MGSQVIASNFFSRWPLFVSKIKICFSRKTLIQQMKGKGNFLNNGEEDLGETGK